MEDSLTNCGNLSFDHYNFLDENLRAVNKGNLGRVKGVKTVQNISSTGGFGSVFNNGNANLSFLLPIGTSNILDICQQMILELTLSNDDATVGHNATILAGQYLIKNIITLTNNQIENTMPEHQMVRRLFTSKDDEEVFQRASLEQFAYAGYPNAYTTSATTIAPSGTQKIYLQIFTPLDVSQVLLPAISQQITIQVYFNNTAVTSTSTSTTVSLQDARLIMNGVAYQPQVRQALLNKFAAKPHVYAYNAAQREILSNISVSSASESNFQISAFSGFKMPCIFLGVRAANASQEDLYTFDQLLTVDERINGQSVYLTKLNKQEFASMAMDCFSTSVANGNTNLVFLPHSIDAYQSLKYNRQRGYQLYNPNVNMLIQMNSVTGSRDLVAIGFAAAVLIVDRGNISLQYL